MKYEMVAGLETHVELTTKTKIFCGCTTQFGGDPNTHCCPICIGLPGTLPKLNEEESPRFRSILENSVKEAHRLHTTDVGTEHLLLSIIRDVDCVAARILITLNINLQKIFQDIMAAAGIDPREYQDEIQEGQKSAGSMVEQYCTDLTAQAEAGRLDPVLGREEEMYRLMQILSRRMRTAI